MWGLSIILISLLYWYNNSWQFLTSVFLIIAIVAFILLFYADESLRFYISVKKDYAKAKLILNKVAKVNRNL
jgi:hypothetical protein